jgi:hypothetical protein
VVYVAWIAGKRNEYKILVRKLEGRRLFGRTRYVWDVNIKKKCGFDFPGCG